MSTLAATMTLERAFTQSMPIPSCFKPLVEQIRDEFLEMPGLSLTLAQVARLFSTDLQQSKRLLRKLLDEGFLVRDARGAFRRRDVSVKGSDAIEKQAKPLRSFNGNEAFGDHPSTPGSTVPPGDLLEVLGVELPCLACDRSYRISLRKIRLSQTMMDAECQVRHFADCPPAAFAHLIDPALLAKFEDAAERIEVAAEGAGGRLVGPR